MSADQGTQGDAAPRIGTRLAAALALSLALLQPACGGSVRTENGTQDVTGVAGVPDAASGSSNGGAAPNTAGARNTSGTASTGAADNASGTGSVASSPSVPLIPADGWLDGSANRLRIQGAFFAAADVESESSMTSDFTGSDACLKGSAARVDLTCPPVAPATDCYGMYWGAMIGLNLNQALDPSDHTGGTAQPFDASSLQGFSFVVTGNTVPAPSSFRFQVESSDGDVYCNVPTKKVLLGVNTFLFSDLVSECFWISSDPPNPSAQTVQSALTRIEWQVVTNTTSQVPYDFCISNVRALRK